MHIPDKRCKNCGHWFTGSRERWGAESRGTAQCTLKPAWIKTDAEHFCGQHTEPTPRVAPACANAEVIDERHGWAEMQNQQDRAIKAEKALKVVRAELRATKTKPA